MNATHRRRPRLAFGASILTGLLALATSAATAAPPPRSLDEYRARVAARVAAQPPAAPEAPMHRQQCVGGMAGIYPCNAIDLMEFMPYAQFAPDPGESVKTNSLWGWIDPVTGHEWALLGLNNGVAFVDVTDPENPLYVGKLPSHGGMVSLWRDVRAHGNTAYVVADAVPHGMQWFDLRRLRAAVPPFPVTFSEDGHYAAQGLGNVHTLSVTAETGYAYLVGSNTCGSRLHMVDLALFRGDFEEGTTAEWTGPGGPAFAGCTTDGDYVHENQCFVYHGPDLDYTGHEVCLAARGGALDLDLVDVTRKSAPVRLGSLHYNPVDGYSHQAWFTDDHRYVLLNDELDEWFVGNLTRTWIIDAADLDAPVLAAGGGYWDHATTAIDHNLYVHGNYVFESNYTAGLRILELTDLAQSQLTEVAYFDLYPAGDPADFDGTWNHYLFPSGNVIATHMTQGMFILQPTGLCAPPAPPTGLAAAGAGDGRIDLTWAGSGAPGATFDVERALGGCGGSFATVAQGIAGPAFSDTGASGQVVYGYRVRERGATGACVSEPSSCVEATTTGACTAPPLFDGLATAVDAGTSACRIDLAWSPATPSCAGPARYSIHRGSEPGFEPGPANRIATGVEGTGWADFGAPADATAYYVVRAADGGNGAEEENRMRRAARATGPVGDGTWQSGAEVGDPTLTTGDGTPGDDPGHLGWHFATDRHRTGARSFWSTAGSNLCLTLEGDFELTAGTAPALTLWSSYETEAGHDGGVLELSTDGGASWTPLAPAGGYPGAFTDSGNACGFATGRGGFTGTQAEFAAAAVDLAPWAGQTVRLRFLYGSDAADNGAGWFLDDLELSHAQVPGRCTPAPGPG